jgi:capsular polysaccharide transport system permease protein
VISAFYLFLIAPDEYVTEYRFSVRVPVGSQVSPGASAGSFAAVFGGNPNPTTDMLDNYTVADYVTSTQAARDLDAKVSLRSMFNKPSDPFSKLGEKPTAERLGKYWRKMVYSNFDPATGLAIVRVHAYSAADSYAIATNLVNLSSDVVNSIGAHSQQDSVRFAQQQLDRANAQVTTLRGQLAELRRQSNVIDPDKGAISGNIDLINQLSNRRAMLQSQLELSQHQLNNAQAPQVLLLKEQIAAVNSQIAQARQSGGSTSGQPNMAVTVGRFEETESKLKNAVIVQASAAQALSTVQTNADAQRLYLTTYVRPAQPESPQAPQRWLAMLQITLAAAMIWVIGRMIGNSIMEHE